MVQMSWKHERESTRERERESESERQTWNENGIIDKENKNLTNKTINETYRLVCGPNRSAKHYFKRMIS